MADSFGWDYIDLSSIPALQNGEIHIYATALEPNDQWAESATKLLAHPEQERAARFRFEVDRFGFQKTRTLLRLLLSEFLSCDPVGIAFREGPHGKPYLTGLESDLQFNVSHTKG
ncbi:MAG: 4'-phosphopantetheinyl transferase family protein, partial [Verrucomicrobiales bacterium]